MGVYLSKKRLPKKSIEHQIHLEKINYPRQISSSHADFDKKNKYEKQQNALEISKEKNGFTLDHFFSFVKLIMVE